MENKLMSMSGGVGKIFVPAALVLTLSFGFAYFVGQQVLRNSANDPQVEIAEGVIEALNQGQDPEAFSSMSPTDMEKSLSPFVIVFDKDGNGVSGTTQLDGQLPTPPKNVFDSVDNVKGSKFSWQPKAGVRIASVIFRYKAPAIDASSTPSEGYVLAGKSLREVDARIQNLMKLTAVAWVIALLLVWGLILLVNRKKQEMHVEGENHENPNHV